MLVKATGLGDTDAKAITLWTLNVDQFVHMLDNDTFTEANLNSATLGSNANQVMQRVSQTKASGTADFDDTQWLTLVGTKGTASSFIWNTVYDEIRFSTTSGDAGLLEVTGIPEPTTVSLLWLLGLFAVLLRRRHQQLRTPSVHQG